jgi:hypothetical protein
MHFSNEYLEAVAYALVDGAVAARAQSAEKAAPAPLATTQRRNPCSSLWTSLTSDVPMLVFTLIYIIGTLVTAGYYFYAYVSHRTSASVVSCRPCLMTSHELARAISLRRFRASPLFPVLGYWICFAKLCAGVIYFNCVVVFLPVCNGLITLLQSKRTTRAAVPVARLFVFHKIAAFSILAAGLGHTAMHLGGTFRVLRDTPCPSSSVAAEAGAPVPAAALQSEHGVLLPSAVASVAVSPVQAFTAAHAPVHPVFAPLGAPAAAYGLSPAPYSWPAAGYSVSPFVLTFAPAPIAAFGTLPLQARSPVDARLGYRFNMAPMQAVATAPTVPTTAAVSAIAAAVEPMVSADTTDELLPPAPPAKDPPFCGLNYWQLIFKSIPGLTGVLLWVCFAAMWVTSLDSFRARHFDTFFVVHQLFLLVIVLLCIHGIGTFTPLYGFKVLWFITVT